MDVGFVYVDDVLGGEIPFLLHSFDQLPKLSELREHTPKIDALRVVCRELGLPRDFEVMSVVCAKASMQLAFDKRLVGERRPWLFVAGASWLPDTRVVRHKGTWREVASHYGMEVRRRGPEVPFESAEGVRFATMVELTDENFADGMRLLRDVRSSAVMLSALNEANTAEEIRRFFRCAFPLRKGVPDIQVDWVSLAAEYCPRGDILIRASGNWDERECSLDFIGEAEQVRAFSQEAKDDVE